MTDINFSKKELETIIASLREHERRMYSDSVLYRDLGNKLAQMDCIEEKRITQHLRERLEGLARNLQYMEYNQ